MARITEQAGVTVAPTGSTGVQANEFEAAIKSVTSATTVGAVFLYDTRNDSDSGAWRKKCQGLSWFDEDLNTATRGGRREFPSVAIIVVDNATSGSVYGTVTIYDGDDPSLPMWRVYNNYVNNSMTGIYALNGRVYVTAATTTQGGGLYYLDFVNDFSARQTDTTSNTAWNHYVQLANSTYQTTSDFFNGRLVNISVNDVDATIVEGSELGALGLPIPTVAVATDGGVSVIHPNGDVYDDTYQVATSKEAGAVGFNSTGGYWYASRLTSGEYQYFINRHNLIYADTSSSTGTEMYRAGASAAGTPSLSLLGGASTRQTAWADTKDTYAIGSTSGLSLIKYNTGNPSEGAVCDVTSSYNTGYMLGDVRFATTTTQTANLSNGANVYDQSVKGNTLTVNAGSGSYITRTKVATDAEMSAFSNFSADNYLSRAYDADFDFGTGDFSIMFWCKLADTVNTTETVLERAYGGNALFNIDFQNGIPRLIAYNGSAFDTTTGTRDLSDNQWHQLMCFRKSGVAYIYIDGKQHVSNAMTYDLDNSQAILHIGQTTGNGNPLANGSLSLLRISATAPTPQQVADIYREEAKLFRSGAKCLLQSDHSSASNTVRDLSFDHSTGLLSVSQSTNTDHSSGVQAFRGLERVSNFNGKDYGWSDGGSNLIASAGGIVAPVRTGGTGGVLVDLPAIDVRGDINTADSKSSNDGKIRFSGVTTDATPTVIGNIPIAENESYNITANVHGQKYNTMGGTRGLYEIKQRFIRAVDGDAYAEATEIKLSDENDSGLDVTLQADTGADTAQIKVTGKAGTRMQWSAELTVQRISEKQYER